MKIDETTHRNIIQFRPYQKPDETEALPNIQRKSTEEELSSPCDPRLYQIIKNVDFSRQFTIKEERDENGKISSLNIKMNFGAQDSIELYFEEEDEVSLLTDSNGEIDFQAAEFFVEHYKKFHKERKENYEKDKQFLISVINEPEVKTLRIYHKEAPKKKKEPKKPEYDGALKEIFDNFKNYDERQFYAALFLNRNERQAIESPIITAKETLSLLALCKKEDDTIDSDDIDKKIHIAVYITNYSQVHKHDCFDEIIEASKDKDGNFDIDYCLALSRILQAGTYSEDYKTEMEQARAFIDKHRESPTFNKIIDNIVTLLQNNEIFLQSI